LRRKLEQIITVLERDGHKTFNSFRDIGNWQTKELPPAKAISWAFNKIKKCDAILAFIDTKEVSKGMHLELGFAKALNKKIILLISKKVCFPTLEALSNHVIRFDDIKDAIKKLIKIKI